ncbi:hypothetical protein CRM22_000135 [Opisthorchis felineus]|uniref:Corticotropin-releasing factor domain-containing protein n=1 Tax=Opisthorchis felineus TaxID=147828 RepID=A0A4S2MNH2_OPIFE|nr:hypothetical protein CRM22_000135 [Opisthorchis felineus]
MRLQFIFLFLTAVITLGSTAQDFYEYLEREEPFLNVPRRLAASKRMATEHRILELARLHRLTEKARRILEGKD